MNKLKITSIQRGCVYDGPGVRTTVFLKGCSLHCPWCCNPETISQKQQWFIDNDKCLKLKGIESKLCQDCIRYGGNKDEHFCPFDVSAPVSEEIESNQLLKTLIKDKELFQENGGVTFSGGEPLLQAEELHPVLQNLKSSGINIAFESTLFVASTNVKRVLPFVNLMIVDLKLQKEQGIIPTYLDTIEANLAILQQHKIDIVYRLVFVNSLVDDKDRVWDTLTRLGVKRIELLKCHNLGSKKYHKLQLSNHDYTADECELELFATFLQSKGLEVELLKV